MTLSKRDTQLRELMDYASCDPQRLQRTLTRFRTVNALVSKWGTTYQAHLRPALYELALKNPGHPARLLDIGCGGGDVLRKIMRLARTDGFEVEALGIDPDPRAIKVALSRKPVAGISWRNLSSGALVRKNARFDIVISNHLLHHLDDQFDEVIKHSETLSEKLCVHSDILRSRIAYAAFATAAWPLTPRTFVYIDGLRSVRRSYTAAELMARLPYGWSVERSGTFRLLAVHTPGTLGTANCSILDQTA